MPSVSGGFGLGMTGRPAQGDTQRTAQGKSGEDNHHNRADDPLPDSAHRPSIPPDVPHGRGRGPESGPTVSLYHSVTRRRRSALPMTETELKLIAAAAIIGLSKRPRKG